MCIRAGIASGAAGSDWLSNIEFILGGNFADSLLGDSLANLLDAGQSTLVAGDSLSGGVGNDTLIGDAGSDLLDGGNDADSLSAGSGDDTLFGGLGIDTVDGGNGADWASYAGPTGAFPGNPSPGKAFGSAGRAEDVAVGCVAGGAAVTGADTSAATSRAMAADRRWAADRRMIMDGP